MTMLWRVPESFPEALIGEYLRDQSPDRFLFNVAKSAAMVATAPVFQVRGKSKDLEEYSSVPNNSGSPLVSAHLVEFLSRHAKGCCEFIDARVLASDGERNDFKLLNILASAPAADLRRSVFTRLKGTEQILGFRALIVEDEAAHLPELFRDSHYLPHIMARSRLASALIEARFKGLEMLRASDIVW